MAVTVTSPTNGSTIADRTPGISGNMGGAWGPGVWRRTQLATDSGFSGVIYEQASTQTTGDTFSFSISGTSLGAILPNGTYYVRVRAEGSGGSSPQAWSSTVSFTVSDPVNTPDYLVPTSATTSTPVVTAGVQPQGGGASINLIELQIASDAGFTTVVGSFSAAPGLSDRWYINWQVSPRLPQGTYYMRARARDEFNTYGSYSSTVTLVVSHAPNTTNHNPALGTAVAVPAAVASEITIPLAWTFTDPDSAGGLDYQTAYEIEAWRASAPGTVDSSGQVVASAPGNAGTGSIVVPDSWEGDDMRWRIRVRDRDNVWGAWSSDKAFTPYFLPVTTITTPTPAQEFLTPSPTFVWTFSATTSRTEAQWKVDIYEGTIGALGVLVETTGWVVSSALTWTPTLPIIEVGTDYVVRVTVRDSVGLESLADEEEFTADYPAIEPAIFTVDGSNFSATGGIVVDWAGTVTLDVDFELWRVYRRDAVNNSWTLIREAEEAETSWVDYIAPTDITVEYAVVQVATKFAALVESVRSPISFLGSCHMYMLVLPDMPGLNLPLWHANADGFQDEQEMAVIKLIGRGRRAEYGTRYGQTGTLDVTFYDNDVMTARQQRLWLEAIRDSAIACWLRNPFGDVWQVALMAAPITRMPGVGQREFATASIEYTEITA